jgi:hypothetical protein
MSQVYTKHMRLSQQQTTYPHVNNANMLIKHYSDISHRPLRKEDRHILRRKDTIPLDTTFVPFTTEQTKEVIKNSKAQGPDQISNLHLKQLGTQGIPVLTNIANYSIQQNIIPTIWKKVKL